METTNEPIITHELLRSWNPCTSGYRRYCELFPEGATLPQAIDGLVTDNHDDWGQWLFVKCRELNLYEVFTAKGYRNAGHSNAGNSNSGHSNAGNSNAGHSNAGHRNAGHRNAGNWNAGHRNAGNSNAGHRNAGHRNAGDSNAGNSNAGDSNAGDSNAGDSNAGDSNAGHRNAGHRNAGNWNAGDSNAGNSNAGNSNAGNWNAGNSNAGYFNSDSPSEIRVFNKPCLKSEFEKASIPSFLYFDTTRWIVDSQMTDQEKIDNPKFYVAGGYLKTIPYKQAFQEAYAAASDAGKALLLKLPNFDADVFFEISGIRVDLPQSGESKQ